MKQRTICLADEYTTAINRNSAYWLDVAQLEKPDLDLEALTSSLALFQGELLPGFYEGWIVLERERIQSLLDIRMGQDFVIREHSLQIYADCIKEDCPNRKSSGARHRA